MSDHISDPELNCILAVCCEAPSAQAGLAHALLRGGACENSKHADRCAEWLMANFDLAPKGSLTQLKADIARVARA